MRFLSICSGIEAASVAFHPLGWQALAFAEIEPFPCSLLAHHYPQVPNLGDLTRWREWSPQLLAQADVLCGGTPCQAFSVAGLRGSLSDERGNLTLTFCHLYDEIDRIRHLHGRSPAVCLWENVPGVLNTPDNAFGHFLAGLAGEDVPLTPPGSRWTDAGYVRGPRRAIAWRVLDAQYFGLAQRRERVFVVASADPAFDPAAVLFELDGLRRDTPPRRGPGEGAAPTLSARTKGGGGLGTDAECDGAVVPERMPNAECRMPNEGVPEVANCLTRRMHKGLNTTLDEGQTPIVEVCAPLTGNAYADNASEESKLVPERRDLEPGRLGDEEMLPFTFKASHFTRGKDGAPSDLAPPLSADADKRDQDTLVAAPIAFPEFLSGTQCASAEDVSPVLQAQNPTAVAYDAESERQRAESFAFDLRGREGGAMPEGPHATANLRAGSGGSSRSYVAQKAEPGVLPFDTTQITSKTNRSQPKAGDPCHPLAAGAHAQSIAFAIQERAVCENPKAGPDGAGVRADDCAYTLEARQVPQAVAFKPRHYRGERKDGAASDICGPLTANAEFAGDCSPHVACQEPVAFSARERGDDGRGYARPPQVFDGAVGALDTMKPHCVACQEPQAYTLHGSREGTQAVASATDTAGTIREGTGTAVQNSSTTVALSEPPSLPVSSSPCLATQWRVRRLTPEECEMLQGFPVGYTLIPGTSSKKRKGNDLRDTIDYLISLGVAPAEAEVLAHSPDGPRYKALGNSWAVPVARWIARRIDACTKALSPQ